MPTRSPSKKTSAAAQKREVSSAGSPEEVQAAIARCIESRQSDDAAQRLTSLLGNDNLSPRYRHTPLPSRLHHELGKLLEGSKYIEPDLIRSKLRV